MLCVGNSQSFLNSKVNRYLMLKSRTQKRTPFSKTVMTAFSLIGEYRYVKSIKVGLFGTGFVHFCSYTPKYVLHEQADRMALPQLLQKFAR